ncbi:hypothetical protein L1987_29075 [Smallanthus sonchifolius]|uniref:Uncharacterized protein n=1 Tax=Smallanthus sonchifolius TaxID=185202 RepID=A0ACB9I0T5_9ASTR|nr:hypothetical protein L1987_29075 [Smallanthus sonchifolius]
MGTPMQNNQLVTIKENYSIPLQCPVLTPTNYTIWAIKLKAIFNVHGLWEAIEPAVGEVVDQKKNSSAIAYLYQSLPEDLILQVANLTSASEVWDSIETRYVGVDRVKKARLQTLRNEFEVLRMKEEETLDEFVGRMSSITSKARDLGTPYDESVIVRKFLSAMPERFVQIVASIEQFIDLETLLLQEAIGRLKAYEERIGMKPRVSNSKGDQLLLTYTEWQNKYKDSENQGGKSRWKGDKVKNNWTNKGRRTNWKGRNSESGHKNSKSVGNQGKDKSKIKCFKCDLYGHYASECPSKNSDPEANLTVDDFEPVQPHLMMTVKVEDQKEVVFLNEHKVVPDRYVSGKNEGHIWYLDNGASNHMTGMQCVFASLDKKVGGNVRFGDGSCVEIEGRGSVILDCNNDEQRLLTNVYFIPKLRSNILSLGQATENGCEIRMKDEFLWFYGSDGKLLMKVLRSPNRLYKVNLKIGSPLCFHTKVEDISWLWHGRLGHVNFETLRIMTSKGMTRRPFPAQAVYRASRPLELISMDLCGPITRTSPAGNKYFMLLVDDCTRFMWIYVIKSKDQAFGVFKLFKAKVEKQYNHQIKALRSDRGGEFVSQEFNKFCDSEGINRLLTVPYSPQQNGSVERRNMTILNMTRSIMKAMKMPQDFWAEGVLNLI